jgi:hypothetical protein
LALYLFYQATLSVFIASLLMENFFFMDFYDEEYEKAYKPRYELVDEKATALVDLALVVLAIALLIEILRLSF